MNFVTLRPYLPKTINIMRVFTLMITLIYLGIGVNAQDKVKQYFKLAENITSSDYERGVVLVKLKEDYKYLFDGGSNAKISNAGVVTANKMFPQKSVRNSQARVAPRKSVSGVDLSLYYTIRISAEESIETAINRLYSTGYFEVVEPSYVHHSFYTPNDPSISNQYYLSKIKAYEAWDISKSSSNVVIAIIDSGGDLDHPDIASKLFVNQNEIPNNGIDDDGNGYVDDVNGWDFSGAETLLIGTGGFNGDNDPSIVKGGGHAHGTMVAGCAAAATDNGVGIAGVGFNARLLFTKHYADDQPENDTFYSSNLYIGIRYAAEVLTDNNIPFKIINCSFGGTGRSQIYQDIINYVTIDLGCLVVAAAGNNNTEDIRYPAGYNNVLSVAATDANDRKSGFSSYGNWVDISAPGSAIYTTQFNDAYGSTQGTSFSCPITSGAAALIWPIFPELTPVQLAEKIRVTSDETFYSQNTNAFQNKLGKGRLDIYRALTENFPSLRASKFKLINNKGSSAIRPGDTGYFYFDIFNYLSSTSGNLEITISSSSSSITFTKNKINPGVISENNKISTKQNPFAFTTANTIAPNRPVDFTIRFTDGQYTDVQVITVILNPTYIDIEENQVSTTVSYIGRVGYEGDGATGGKGLGFEFKGTPLLYEMGLLMGNSAANILNNVRGVNGTFDQDFISIKHIDQIFPGERSATEIFGTISNSANPSSQSILIDYRSLVWRDTPNNKFVILEYKLKNPTASAIINYRFGLFADWDISAGDGAAWNATYEMGYVFPKDEPTLPLGGIQVLTGNANHYAIDNLDGTEGAPFGLYNGSGGDFTDTEKFTSLSTSRTTAGIAADGGDVSHVVSVGPFNLEPNQEITIAFALHGAADLDELVESAEAAKTLYQQTLQAPKPLINLVETCYGNGAVITATGAGSYKWYHEFTDGEPFFTGDVLITSNLFSDTVFYVSNADNSYESVRTPAVVNVRANPQINSSGSLNLCEGGTLILSALEADEYLWSTGAVTQSIEVNEAGEYSITVKDNDLECESTSDDIQVTLIQSPVALFSAIVESFVNTPIQFTDVSTDAVSWYWQFGNGTTSTLQNPLVQFNSKGDFETTLTVTSANGCTDSYTDLITIITSSEKELQSAVTTFPNPTKANLIVEAIGLSSPYFSIQVLNAQGQIVYNAQDEASDGKLSHSVPSSTFPSGLYFVKVFNERNVVIRKVVKSE
jgi:serine protease